MTSDTPMGRVANFMVECVSVSQLLLHEPRLLHCGTRRLVTVSYPFAVEFLDHAFIVLMYSEVCGNHSVEVRPSIQPRLLIGVS